LKAYTSFVPEKYQNFTLLNYLLNRFPYHTREDWSQRIVDGHIRVNSMLKSENDILTKGDEVSYLPAEKIYEEPPINSNYQILFENSDFLVVDKPPNIPVHPAGRYRTHSLLTLLEKERGISSCYPVHRLDRETSGVMIFAKQKSYQLMLQGLFENREVKKRYIIFVFGQFPKYLQTNGYIGRDINSQIRKKQIFSYQNFGDSKTSVTEFHLKEYLEEKNISVLNVDPYTGRIHQIRATLYSLGYPVVGDKLYGKRESAFLDFVKMGENIRLNEELGHSRQALHSSEIGFFDTIREQEFHFFSPLPKDLSHFHVSNS